VSSQDPDQAGPPEDPPADLASSGPAPATGASVAWRRIGGAVLARPDRAQLVMAVLLFALGFGVVVQARQTDASGLIGLNQSELVRLLDQVSDRRTRLEAEQQDLQERISALTSDTGSAEEARRAAEERRDALAVLAGTVPTVGPGVTVTIRDVEGEVSSVLLLDAVQELRDAGAEAIQIGDVRVVGSTALADVRDGIQVDGQVVRSPFRIVAIGDQSTLETALRIPGGVVDSVSQLAGAEIAVTPSDQVLVDAVVPLNEPEFVTPAPVDADG
jgi:uncharacterized protein YlxW (UPF0749 family)